MATDPPGIDDATRRRMQANRRRDTGPELAVRRALHGMGRRYRCDVPIRASGRPVRADIVFTRQRVAVFIDGCFWHGCPLHATVSRRNHEYWAQKIERNRERDLEQVARLAAKDWTVLRFWEHEDPIAVAVAIDSALKRCAHEQY